jgi:hypothetical protein
LFGLDDDEMAIGVNLQVSPPAITPRLQSHRSARVVSLGIQALQDEVEQSRAARESKGKRSCQVILIPSQQVENA